MDPVPSNARFDLYRTVTDKIIVAMENGVDPFTMPWHGTGGLLARPVNASTGAAYRGVNVVALWAAASFHRYGSAEWASYKQWQSLGGQVRQGEHGTVIVFFKEVERENFGEPDGEVDTPKLIARASRVFNSDQVYGLTPRPPATPSPFEEFESVDEFVSMTGADIRHGGEIACYHPPGDFIQMPEHERFCGTRTRTATESYYGVLLHELTHWTGASHRLNRELGTRFGSMAYAMEELVAELGAAFLCADLKITNEPRPDHAAYIQSWLEVLKQDRKAIFVAASQASRATDFLSDLAEAAL